MHILIVDDHTIIRRGLQNLLAAQFPGSTLSFASGVRQAGVHLHSGKIDLMLLDLMLADGNALDKLGTWCIDFPRTHILVYSMVSEDLVARRAISLGAAGFLPKEATEEEVISAIHKVLQGGIYLSPKMEALVGSDPKSEDLQNPFSKLSDQEGRVLQDLLAGKDIMDIAETLGISRSAVATYKSRLFNKLGVTNLLELQRTADIHGFRVP
jgi:two-component system, NarL family, invasion response regulator UvrY